MLNKWVNHIRVFITATKTLKDIDKSIQTPLSFHRLGGSSSKALDYGLESLCSILSWVGIFLHSFLSRLVLGPSTLSFPASEFGRSIGLATLPSYHAVEVNMWTLTSISLMGLHSLSRGYLYIFLPILFQIYSIQQTLLSLMAWKMESTWPWTGGQGEALQRHLSQMYSGKLHCHCW